jgi:hypothetical protein
MSVRAKREQFFKPKVLICLRTFFVLFQILTQTAEKLQQQVCANFAILRKN